MCQPYFGGFFSTSRNQWEISESTYFSSFPSQWRNMQSCSLRRCWLLGDAQSGSCRSQWHAWKVWSVQCHYWFYRKRKKTGMKSAELCTSSPSPRWRRGAVWTIVTILFHQWFTQRPCTTSENGLEEWWAEVFCSVQFFLNPHYGRRRRSKSEQTEVAIFCQSWGTCLSRPHGKVTPAHTIFWNWVGSESTTQLLLSAQACAHSDKYVPDFCSEHCGLLFKHFWQEA